MIHLNTHKLKTRRCTFYIKRDQRKSITNVFLTVQDCKTIFYQGESKALNVIKDKQGCHLSLRVNVEPLMSSCVLQVVTWLPKLFPPVADRTLYHRQANYRAGQSNKLLCATKQVTNDPLIQGDVPIYCTRTVIAMYIAAHWRCRGTASFVIFKAIVNH